MRNLSPIVIAAVFCWALAWATFSIAATPPPLKLQGTPFPYAARINMLGCGVAKTVTVAVGKRVLFVNAGTAVRHVYSTTAPMPQWGLKTGMWVETSLNGVGTVKLAVKHAGCARTDHYTIKT